MVIPPRHDGNWGKHQGNLRFGEFAKGPNIRDNSFAKLLFLPVDLDVKLALIAIS